MTLYRHTINGVYPGEEWSTTIHTTSTLSLEAAQGAWTTAWQQMMLGADPPADNIDQFISTLVSTTTASTSQLDAVTGRQTAKVEDDLAQAGTSTAALLPPQNSVVVSWGSVSATRSGRGRMYLPAFTVVALDDGLVLSAAQTKIKAAAQNLLDSFSGAGVTPVLLNRVSKATTPITTVRVGNIVDTQRRRRDKLVETYV